MYETDKKTIEELTFNQVKKITLSHPSTRWSGSTVTQVMDHMIKKGVVSDDEEAYVHSEVMKENGY